MRIITVVAVVLFLAGCSSDDEAGDLFGIGGLIWPGPTSEFDEWLNRDLSCGGSTYNLMGSSAEARPPNDPSYVENTYWSRTGSDGMLINQGIWYTSRADQFTGSSLTLRSETGSVQNWELSADGLEYSSAGRVCTVI